MSKRYAEVLLEDMNDKFDAIMEYVVILSELTELPAKLDAVDKRLQKVEAILEMSVKHFSSILESHETRLTTLESNK